MEFYSIPKTSTLKKFSSSAKKVLDKNRINYYIGRELYDILDAIGFKNIYMQFSRPLLDTERKKSILLNHLLMLKSIAHDYNSKQKLEFIVERLEQIIDSKKYIVVIPSFMQSSADKLDF